MIKAEIKELTHDEAIILMVESNDQRSSFINSPFGESVYLQNAASKSRVHEQI